MYREGTYLNIIKILYDKLTANAIFIGEKAESIPSKIRNKARMSIVATFIQHSFGNTAAAAAKSLQSCPTLCDPRDSSPPGSPVPGILQARTLEWVAISFSNGMKVKSENEVAQSCPTPRDPMDCSLSGSLVHGIFQARILEWVAIAFS